jgi:predicted DCC family thiol-disulfide oxidoreductase YuxK
MALAGRAINSSPEPSWNPLRCGGTELPIELLLMAKLIALSLLLTHHVRLLPDPFLPFLPFLDQLPPQAFQRTLQAIFLISAVALLFNRRARLSCLILGGTILLAVVSSRAYYGNNKTFCGLILFLTGLYHPAWGPWLVRAQVIIIYFGAGLNKLLDPDWQSGVFFEHWAGVRLHHPAYLFVASVLPALVLGKIMCWGTIVTELGLSIAFTMRRLYPLAIWVSLLFHSSLLLFTGSTFTMFFYAMQASMLAFAPWPQPKMLAIWDGDCGFCSLTKKWFERLDLEGLLEWRTWQSGVGRLYGISDAALGERLHLVAEGKIYSGFHAFQIMLLYNPLTYFVMVVLIAGPYPRIAAGLLLAFFLPVFRPVGEAAYNLVARNRNRLMPNSSCQVQQQR